MVNSMRMLAAALAVAFSAPLFAQGGFPTGNGGTGGFPSGNGGTGGLPSGNGGTTGAGYAPGSNPGGSDSNKKKVELEDESIVARYFTAEAPKNAKSVLERMKGVSQVVIDEEKKRIEVKWTGNYDGIPALESALSNIGATIKVVSHARVSATFRPMKGATPATLERDLGKVAKKVRVAGGGGSADLFVDLDKYSLEDLKNAASYANMEMKVNNYEWISINIEAGDKALLEKEMLVTKGVLTVGGGSDKIEGWTIKKVKDELIQNAAKKTEVTIKDMTRT